MCSLGRWFRTIFACALALSAVNSYADVRLHGLFADHMVLQRDMPIHIWGEASPGESVSVSFRSQKARTIATKQGRWSVYLRPQRAGGPDELIIAGTNTLRLSDVLVGDVWLCAGQSNMEWPLKKSLGGAEEISHPKHASIRHARLPNRTALAPQSEIAPLTWTRGDTSVVGNFSGVGYFFAKRIQSDVDVPIGLIDASWGGTDIETWLHLDAIKKHHELREVTANFPASTEQFFAQRLATGVARALKWDNRFSHPENVKDWASALYDDTDWKTMQLPGVWENQGLDRFDGTVWFRRHIDISAEQARADATLVLGMIDDCDETYVNNTRVGDQCTWDAKRVYKLPTGLLTEGKNTIAVRVKDTGGNGGFHGDAANMSLLLSDSTIPFNGTWKARIEAVMASDALAKNDLPSVAYNAMIHPLTPFGIRGVLWYQGENNVSRARQYQSVFPLLIRDWRARWNQGDFPFLYVQLASFLPVTKNSNAGSAWSELRDAQRLAINQINTGMAVTTDVGDPLDIHPRDKRTVGERLALFALKKVYGGRAQAGGPFVKSARRIGKEMHLTFGNTAGALQSKDGVLRGFTIADASKLFRPATARIISANRIALSAEGISRPLAVRYGWVDNPSESNLINRAGLPTSPFRTDHWPMRTQDKKYAF